MARTAKLHDGEEMQFPDGITDAEMDAAVKQRIAEKGGAAGGGAQDPMGGLLPVLLQAVTQHMGAQGEQTAQMTEQQQQRDAAMVQMQQEHNAQVVASISQTGEMLGQALAAIAQNTAGNQEVVRAVDQLSATLLESVKILATILTTPRQIQRDAAGVPVAIGPVQRS